MKPFRQSEPPASLGYQLRINVNNTTEELRALMKDVYNQILSDISAYHKAHGTPDPTMGSHKSIPESESDFLSSLGISSGPDPG